MMKFIVLMFVAFGLFIVGCTHSSTTEIFTPDGERVVTDKSGFGSSTRTDTTKTKEGYEDCLGRLRNSLGPNTEMYCLQRASVPLNGGMQGGSMMMQQGYGLGLVPMMPNAGGPVTIFGAQTMSPQQSAFSNTNGTVGLIETSSPAGPRGGSGDQEVVVETTKAVADHSRRIKKIENRLARGKK